MTSLTFLLHDGTGGTAIARPVATAIAGLSPSDLAALGLPSQLAHKAMKNDQFKFVFQGNNYPFVRPSEWNAKLPEAKNRPTTIEADASDDAGGDAAPDDINRRSNDAAAAAAADTRKWHREQLLQVPYVEGISRNQFLGDVFSHQYNWPINPYNMYVPLYK